MTSRCDRNAVGPRRVTIAMAWVVALGVVASACATEKSGPEEPSAITLTSSQPVTELKATAETDNECADVIGVDAARSADGTYRFDVTVSSPDEGWDKYADEWQILDGETVLGTRVLAHPHVDEQPFTRSLSGVSIPDGVGVVSVRARDSVTGYCGAAMAVSVP